MVALKIVSSHVICSTAALWTLAHMLICCYILVAKHFCLAGHFLWCGERTRQLDAAHVEFMRGIGNPIGVKVSDKMDPNDLVTMIHAFNPENTPGRLAVIVRMGEEKLRAKLPALVSAVQRAGQTVTWICDPMHGNTESCGTYKTRRWVNHAFSTDAARLLSWTARLLSLSSDKACSTVSLAIVQSCGESALAASSAPACCTSVACYTTTAFGSSHCPNFVSLWCLSPA